jgi:nucleotide-binding universal stress UspA family protein
MFHTIVVGADDSQTARQAVVAAADIAQMSGASLVIVTAYDPKSVRIEHLPPELRLSTTVHPADHLLKALATIGQERGLLVALEAVTGSPADAVVKVAEQTHADLIVVGNKGMRGTRRVLGSVPNSIAHAAPCSVLIVDTEAADSYAPVPR